MRTVGQRRPARRQEVVFDKTINQQSSVARDRAALPKDRDLRRRPRAFTASPQGQAVWVKPVSTRPGRFGYAAP